MDKKKIFSIEQDLAVIPDISTIMPLDYSYDVRKQNFVEEMFLTPLIKGLQRRCYRELIRLIEQQEIKGGETEMLITLNIALTFK